MDLAIREVFSHSSSNSKRKVQRTRVSISCSLLPVTWQEKRSRRGLHIALVHRVTTSPSNDYGQENRFAQLNDIVTSTTLGCYCCQPYRKVFQGSKIRSRYTVLSAHVTCSESEWLGFHFVFYHIVETNALHQRALDEPPPQLVAKTYCTLRDSLKVALVLYDWF